MRGKAVKASWLEEGAYLMTYFSKAEKYDTFYLSHLIILRKQVNTETWIFWEYEIEKISFKGVKM